jgi:hypothetical protein
MPDSAPCTFYICGHSHCPTLSGGAIESAAPSAPFLHYTRPVTSILGDWKLDAALGSCLLLGLRHGFDYDHLAAISDITAVQRNWRSGLRLGMTYALGHAFTVAALGIAVLELHMGLPQGLDHWTERLIGLTLIVLGIGVVAGILRKDAHGHSHSRIESRLAIAINGVLWLAWQVRRIWNRRPPSPSAFSGCTTENRSSSSAYSTASALKPPASWPSSSSPPIWAEPRAASWAWRLLYRPGGHECGHDRLHGRSLPRQRPHHPRFYHAIAWTGAAYSCIIGSSSSSGSPTICRRWDKTGAGFRGSESDQPTSCGQR